MYILCNLVSYKFFSYFIDYMLPYYLALFFFHYILMNLISFRIIFYLIQFTYIIDPGIYLFAYGYSINLTFIKTVLHMIQ